jgi:hypothetical protein
MASKRPGLFSLMSLAQHRLFKSTDAAFKDEVGVSRTQLAVLWFFEQSPGAMLKDVSDELVGNFGCCYCSTSGLPCRDR